MRKYFLVVIITCLGCLAAAGQSAVFVCEKTGKWHAVHDDGNAPRSTMKEVEKEALKGCIERGGEDCRLFFSSKTKGRYAFFTGGEKGKYVFAIGTSQLSEKDAYKKATNNYLQKGGVIRPGCEYYSWYYSKDAIKKE